jgi:DNA-binding MarR family transcriptional regulator
MERNKMSAIYMKRRLTKNRYDSIILLNRKEGYNREQIAEILNIPIYLVDKALKQFERVTVQFT